MYLHSCEQYYDMAGRKAGKRTREQSTKGNSGISPPSKRTAVKQNKKVNSTSQPPISDWIYIGEEESFGDSSENIESLDTELEIPPPSQFTATDYKLLSPITSQPGNSAERRSLNNSDVTTPISDALNIAASATSLSKDLQLCEIILTEKHQFLVAMLDGMNKKVTSIADKIFTLEQRVDTMEKKEYDQANIAQDIFQASNKRQNDLESKMKSTDHSMNNLTTKVNTFSTFESRIKLLENTIAQQCMTQPCKHDCDGNPDNSVAIYGLPEYDDVTKSTNQLFADMNLAITCKSAYRTPSRLHVNRVGVVIAELGTLRDKQAILERKRFIRHHPFYANVFIKTAKSHVEQVMSTNFNIVLNEMTNGQEYFLNDNGRIIKRSRSNFNGGTGNKEEYTHGYPANHGGARPKSSQYNGDYNRRNGINGHYKSQSDLRDDHYSHDSRRTYAEIARRTTQNDNQKNYQQDTTKTYQDTTHRTPHGPSGRTHLDYSHSTSKDDTHRTQHTYGDMRTLDGPRRTQQDNFSKPVRENTIRNHQDDSKMSHEDYISRTQQCDNRNSYNTNNHDYTAAYDSYTQQYMDRFSNAPNSQAYHTANYSVGQLNTKN